VENKHDEEEFEQSDDTVSIKDLQKLKKPWIHCTILPKQPYNKQPKKQKKESNLLEKLTETTKWYHINLGTSKIDQLYMMAKQQQLPNK
jgi:hypothetical protein